MRIAKHIIIGLAAASAVGGMATSAYAQRNPAYAQARAAGKIGEKPDGYVGIVGAPTPELQKIVSSINIQRKAVYTKQAEQGGGTVEQRAFVAGCNLIERTKPGEMYMTPGGAWKERGSGAPERDSRCV
ncbi:YdbL family protein [Stakelama saccharophila]|uniref:YdbL family protein n=1 Tax=Stakelama saccharophila TaxID=3075605 RepID=A0ABZ0BCS1_9SPHN|nr:YdbL family protein [Stakelama sp. W311]WNO54653.1 YdbL family protein [Stakelama sp. W311]